MKIGSGLYILCSSSPSDLWKLDNHEYLDLSSNFIWNQSAMPNRSLALSLDTCLFDPIFLLPSPLISPCEVILCKCISNAGPVNIWQDLDLYFFICQHYTYSNGIYIYIYIYIHVRVCVFVRCHNSSDYHLCCCHEYCFELVSLSLWPKSDLQIKKVDIVFI